LILATEICNILADFWYTNVFGGIWGFIVLFANWILIFITGRISSKKKAKNKRNCIQSF